MVYRGSLVKDNVVGMLYLVCSQLVDLDRVDGCKVTAIKNDHTKLSAKVYIFKVDRQTRIYKIAA